MAVGPVSWNAEDYAHNSSAQMEWARELLGALCLGPAENVLDIGCGDGRVTAEIAARVPRGGVTGIDSSPDMIQRARAAFPPELHANLRFLAMDARAITLEGFDAAFSNAVMHWIADQPSVLRGVRSALRPGGRLLFQMGGRGNAAGIIEALDTLASREPWKRWIADTPFPYTFTGPEQYSRWLREAGFEPRRAVLIPKRSRYGDRAGLEGWVRTTWMPYTERVPSEERGRFVAALVDAYLARHPAAEDGSVGVDMVRLEVEAVRQ
jgi:trans-aconitate 2-methyltransferase